MEVMQPCRNPAVIPEVEGVQAFPPAFFSVQQAEQGVGEIIKRGLYSSQMQ